MGAAALAGWLGLMASIVGLVAAGLFARASGRTVDDESARNALLLLDGMPVGGAGSDSASAGPRPAERPTDRALRDLTDEILRKNKANRRDMRLGAWLLLLTFALLVLQSLVMLGVAGNAVGSQS